MTPRVFFDGGPCSQEIEAFLRLTADELVYGTLLDGSFIDIGVPDDYARAQTEAPGVVGESS